MIEIQTGTIQSKTLQMHITLSKLIHVEH